MFDKFKTHLTELQYNKICKYWKYIDKYSHKLYKLEHNSSLYMLSDEYSKDDYFYMEKLKNKLTYYQQEYERYINNIGFTLNNETYDEHLFNLLNNGIVLIE
jgi:hypothetical protein